MPPIGPIERIVVLMMENNSFDRMLGFMQSVRPGTAGVDPAHPRFNQDWPGGQPIVQTETRSRNIADDPDHDLDDVMRQVGGGRMDGFVIDFAQKYPTTGADERREIMAYYPRGFLPALHFLAETYVVCDHWFSSVPGPTWPNRFFAHSGTSLGHIDMPEGIFTPNLHLYDQRTLYDELHDALLPWRIYYGDFPQSLVMTSQFKYRGNYRKFDQWAADVASGDLPAFVFIEPAYFGADENDQHPPHDIYRGDVLIANVYNTLRSNPALFAKTLLVVAYDEHGGFYDHVAPPRTIAPDANVSAFAFDQFGVRVPAILVSPWLDPGTISDVFDHTSLIRMACDLWNLPTGRLGARAAQSANPFATAKWRSTPRASLGPAPVANARPVTPLPALAGHKQSLFGFSQYLESQLPPGPAKQALVARAPEAMGDSLTQSKLATDRLAAFLASPH